MSDRDMDRIDPRFPQEIQHNGRYSVGGDEHDSSMMNSGQTGSINTYSAMVALGGTRPNGPIADHRHMNAMYMREHPNVNMGYGNFSQLNHPPSSSTNGGTPPDPPPIGPSSASSNHQQNGMFFAHESPDPRVRAAGLAVAAAEQQYKNALLNLRMFCSTGEQDPPTFIPSMMNPHPSEHHTLMPPTADLVDHVSQVPHMRGGHPYHMSQVDTLMNYRAKRATGETPVGTNQSMQVFPPYDPRSSNSNMSITVNGQNQELADHPYSFLLNDIRRNKRPLSSDEYDHSMQYQQDKKDKKKKPKLSGDAPRRPLTAYNFFFSEEREIILAQLPDPDDNNAIPNVDADEKKNPGQGQNDEGGGVDDVYGGSSGTNTNTDKEKMTEKIIATMRELRKEEKNELQEKIKANTERILKTHKESERVKKSHRKMHGKIPFQMLAKIVGQRWRALSPSRKEHYENLARVDMQRFETQMKKYEEQQKTSSSASNSNGGKNDSSES